MDYTPIAPDYDRVEGEDLCLRRLGYDPVLTLLSPLRDKKILDYGCGTGMFSRLLRDRGAIVTGVDVSPGMIEIANRTNPEGISYHLIESGNLKRFNTDSFDHAVSNFVFCAIPETDVIRLILAGIFRILKTGGTFFMMNSNWEAGNGKEFLGHKLEYCNALVTGCKVRVVTKSTPPIVFEDYFRSMEEYRELLEEAGFRAGAPVQNLAPSEETLWLSEREFPPYFFIVGRK